jgi:hypothetical protein
MTKKLSECPYCKRPSDGIGINHVGGCAGLQDVVLNRLQYDGLIQEIERLRAHRNVCVQHLRLGAEQIRAADQRLSPYYMVLARLLRIAVILDSAANNAMADEPAGQQYRQVGVKDATMVAGTDVLWAEQLIDGTALYIRAEPASEPGEPLVPAKRIPPRDFDPDTHQGLYTEPALAHSADVRREIKGKGDVPESQFAGILKAAESGDEVNTMDLINALWWRVGNQRRELARKNADIERLMNDCQELTCGDPRLVSIDGDSIASAMIDADKARS